MNDNPLQPLADALLAARHDDGTWPEPLDWLVEQVFPVPTEDCPVPVAEGLPVPHDPVALRWPEGWATGLGLHWWKQNLNRYRWDKWYDILGDMLADSAHEVGDQDAIYAMTEAVKMLVATTHE